MKFTIAIESPDEFEKKYENLLEQLEFESDYKVINRKVFTLFDTHPIFSLQFSKKFKDFPVFRIVDEYAGFDKFNIDCYSYKRPKKNVERNRANIKETPVFYCATDPKLAIEESKFLDTKIVFLSKWNLNLENERYFPIFYETRNRRSTISNMMNDSISELTKDWDEEPKSWYLNKLKKFTDLFTYDGNKFYNISSAIAHKCLFEIGQLSKDSILVYPSVSKRGNKFNFAIKPEFVDNKLKCNLTSIAKVQLLGKKINVISQAIIIDNDIYWNDFSYKEFFFNNKITLLINGNFINTINKDKIIISKDSQLSLDKLINSLISTYYLNIKSALDFEVNEILFKEVNSIKLKFVQLYFYFDDLTFDNLEKIDMIHIEGYTTFFKDILFCTKVENINNQIPST